MDNVCQIVKVGQLVVVVEEDEFAVVAHHQEKIFVEVPDEEVGLTEAGLDSRLTSLHVDLKSDFNVNLLFNNRFKFVAKSVPFCWHSKT
jgi:hypothetical protein